LLPHTGGETEEKGKERCHVQICFTARYGKEKGPGKPTQDPAGRREGEKKKKIR